MRLIKHFNTLFLFDLLVNLVPTTSQDDAACRRPVTQGKPFQILVAGELVAQGGLDQVLTAGEVGNLVRRNRVAILERVQVLIHEDRLGIFEV